MVITNTKKGGERAEFTHFSPIFSNYIVLTYVMNVIKLGSPVRTKFLLQKAHWPEELGDCTVALVSAFKGELGAPGISPATVCTQVSTGGSRGQRRGQVHA